MSEPVFLHVVLKVRSEGYQRFCEAMEKHVALLGTYGWKLVGAWETTIGRLNTIVDIWELPDANAYAEGLAKVATTPGYQDFMKLLSETVDDEVVTMVKKVAYSP